MIFRLTYILFNFFVLIFLFSCDQEAPAPIDEELLATGMDSEVARDVEILFSDSAQIKVRATGPKMLYFHERTNVRQEFTEGVQIDFFDENQNISSVLTAKYGIRLETQNKVIVRDSVVWKSVEGDMLETSELIWEERKKKVHTNKFVVVTRPDEIVYGHGFEADQHFKDIRMYAIDGRKKIDQISKEFE